MPDWFIDILKISVGAITGGGTYKLLSLWLNSRKDDRTYIADRYREQLEDARQQMKESRDDARSDLRNYKSESRTHIIELFKKLKLLEDCRDKLKNAYNESLLENIKLQARINSSCQTQSPTQSQTTQPLIPNENTGF